MSVPPQTARVCDAAVPKLPQPRIGRMAGNASEKLIVENRRARHEYNLLDRVEAGLAPAGREGKLLRQGPPTLPRALPPPRHGEPWVVGAAHPPHQPGSAPTHHPPPHP